MARLGDERRELVRQGYDREGGRYHAARPVDGRDVALLAEVHSRIRPAAQILDVGCGSGVSVARCLVALGHAVVGVDISLEQLVLARAHVAPLKAVEGEMSSLPVGTASFDALVSYYAVIHVPREDHSVVFAEFPSRTAGRGVGARVHRVERQSRGQRRCQLARDADVLEPLRGRRNHDPDQRRRFRRRLVVGGPGPEWPRRPSVRARSGALERASNRPTVSLLPPSRTASGEEEGTDPGGTSAGYRSAADGTLGDAVCSLGPTLRTSLNPASRQVMNTSISGTAAVSTVTPIAHTPS